MTTSTHTAPSNTLSMDDFTMTSRATFDADLNKALLLSVLTEMEPQYETGASASGVQSLYDTANGRNINLDDTGKSTWESMEEPAAYLTDIGIIHAEATGLQYFAPGLRTVRKTHEWEAQCQQVRSEFRFGISMGQSPEYFSDLALNEAFIQVENEMHEPAADLDQKLANELPLALCSIWATADAICLERTGKLWEQGDEPVLFFQSQHRDLDLYSESVTPLADRMFTVLVVEHYRGVEARLAASRAKKAATAATKKKAAAKAAKKARKR